MVDYVFYSVVGLGISIILYRSLLKNEKLFKFNRFFLLASLSLCLLAPVLQIDFGNNFEPIKNVRVGEIMSSGEIMRDDPEKSDVETISATAINYHASL
jgi:N-acetylmuramoyl-L-alanine amidase